MLDIKDDRHTFHIEDDHHVLSGSKGTNLQSWVY